MENYKWLFEILFSGLGTAIFGYLFFKTWKHYHPSQKQKSGKNSINLQAGRDIDIKSNGNSNGKK